IGDPDVLASCGIRMRIPLRGVGRNLQDRYEVPIVNRMKKPWDMLDQATFTTSDPQYRRWAEQRRGVYTSNGALLCVIQRSGPGEQAPDLFAKEELPGDDVQSDADLRRFVRDHAWGHHASCTCAIGPEASGGVLTADFKVHRTQGLRVVDASVFPRTPGLFIVSAIYMIGEKAADAIVASAQAP